MAAGTPGQLISSCIHRSNRWGPACYRIDVQRQRLHLPIFPLPTKKVSDLKAFIALTFHRLISLHKTLRLAFKIEGQTILNDLNALITKRQDLKPGHRLHHQVTGRMLIASVTTDTGWHKRIGIASQNKAFKDRAKNRCLWKKYLREKAKCLVWRNMTGAQSHTCTQADECVPSINNECTITEKFLLNTLFFSQSCWAQKECHLNNNRANTNRQVKRGQTSRLQLGTELTFWL